MGNFILIFTQTLCTDKRNFVFILTNNGLLFLTGSILLTIYHEPWRGDRCSWSDELTFTWCFNVNLLYVYWMYPECFLSGIPSVYVTGGQISTVEEHRRPPMTPRWQIRYICMFWNNLIKIFSYYLLKINVFLNITNSRYRYLVNIENVIQEMYTF